jgi:hypothetical protein
MPMPTDYAGRKFDRITLEAPVPGRPGYWTGRCDCGTPVVYRVDNLKRPGLHTCDHCRSLHRSLPTAVIPLAYLERT